MMLLIVASGLKRVDLRMDCFSHLQRGVRSMRTASASRSSLECCYASPDDVRFPAAMAEGLDLQDLAVIDEEIHLRLVRSDVPLEHRWIRSFEHDLLESGSGPRSVTQSFR